MLTANPPATTVATRLHPKKGCRIIRPKSLDRGFAWVLVSGRAIASLVHSYPRNDVKFPSAFAYGGTSSSTAERSSLLRCVAQEPSYLPLCWLSAWYDPRGMIVLFSIAMVCFFALFGMMIILLRQAKAEGALTRPRHETKSRGDRVSEPHASSGVSQARLNLNLSNLVPAKQPDWRFMVRDGSREARAYSVDRNGPTVNNESRADRRFAHKDLGDLTDPQTSNLARRA